MSICKKNEKCARADCHFVHGANKCILWDRCRVAGCGSRHAICDMVLRDGFCQNLPQCGLNHPPPCRSNDRCTDECCTFLHASAKCRNWGACNVRECTFRHSRRPTEQHPRIGVKGTGIPAIAPVVHAPRPAPGPATNCPRYSKCWAPDCAMTHTVAKCTSWDTCTSHDCRRRLRHAKQEKCGDAAVLGYCSNQPTCSKLHPNPCNSPQSCWQKECTYLHAVAMCSAWSDCVAAGCKLRHAKKERCQDAQELGYCPALPNCAKSHPKRPCANITKCWHKECPLLHAVAMCANWDSCQASACDRRHAKKEWCQAAASLGYCPSLPNCVNTHKPLCEQDMKCWHADCKLLHSVARCTDWDHCVNDGCDLRHAKRECCQAAAILGFCSALSNCHKTHKPLCQKDSKCWHADCKLLHSVAKCGSWDKCTAEGCQLRHAKPKVFVEPCAEAVELGYCPSAATCKKWHPPPCINNRTCWSASCPRMHRVAKCAAWSTCTDAECRKLLRHGKSSMPAKPAGVKRAYSSPRAALLRHHNAAAAVTADDVSVDSETTSHYSVASSRSSLSTVSLPSAVAVLGLAPVKVPAPSKRCVDYNKCNVFECAKVHGKYRRGPCNYGEACVVLLCKFLHPAGWWAADRALACPLGARCMEEECTLLRHPRERDAKLRLAQEQKEQAQAQAQEAAALAATKPGAGDAVSDTKKAATATSARPPPPPVKTKNREQREKDRQKAGFTILGCREVFIQRLLADRVVIITAETGSGKTTQLPQYCAEALEDGRLAGSAATSTPGAEAVNMTFCTQPRKFAARSIAKRVGEEFDGSAHGPSVGYTVGGGSENKRGSRIMFCTDAMLVRKAQSDPQLRDISVLIIDEAHERCLYTDIVLGIAKNLLAQRSDFYVVVASATIEPAVFLNFFFGNRSPMPGPLKVPGRLYEIDLVYKPPVSAQHGFDFITAHVVPQTKQALRDYTEGHVLVFLQGQKEIEKALRAFNDLNLRDVLAFPLYSGLEEVDQDKVMNFDQKFPKQRMVVFCTNVAETSITVPGVKIVIDSGLAKASRFDSQRGLQIVEEVFICRSSADQRKGRAGRTSSGTCIRLYSDQDLVRESIEPEILHSSLELVALRLLCFNQDPREFPYIAEVEDESPDKEFRYNIEVACSKLEELGCCTLTAAARDGTATKGAVSQRQARVTEKGRLFSDMPFDPRYCAFILEAASAYGKAEVATIVAAILMGQGKKVDRDKRDLQRSEVMKGALVHRSDLLYKLQMYLGWANACNTAACPKCKAAVVAAASAAASAAAGSKESGERRPRCFKCSRENATSFGLDEQSLKSVEKTVLEVRAILSKSRTTLDRIAAAAPSDVTTSTVSGMKRGEVDDLEVIGRCLARFFYDHLVEMIAPTHPEAGVRLVRSCQRGKIDGLSCTLQRVTDAGTAPTHMISMDSKQTSRGDIYVNDMHPIDPAWLPDAAVIARCSRYETIITDFSFQEVAVVPNVGLKLYSAVELKFFDDADDADSDWKEWVHLSHDVFEAKMKVFAPEQYANEAADLIERIHQDVSHELLNTHEALETVCDGKLLAHVTSGVKVTAISLSGNQMEVKKLPSDQVFDDTSLRDYLYQLCPAVSRTDALSFCRFSKASICFAFVNTGKCPRDACFHSHDPANAAQGLLMLKDDTLKAQLQEALGIGEDTGDQEGGKRRATVDGTVLSFKLTGRITDEQLTAALDQIFIRDGYASRVETCESTPPQFDLVVNSLPIDFPEGHIQTLLMQGTTVAAKYEIVKAKTGRSKTAYCHFADEYVRDNKAREIQYAILSQNIPTWKYIKIFPQDGARKCKVTLSDLDGADHLCQNARADLQRLGISDSLESRGSVYVQLYKKYRIRDILADIRERCADQVRVAEVPAANKNDQKYLFSGTPSLVAKAANLFKAATKPLHYKARTRRESVFVSELFSDGRLASLAVKHDLALVEKGHVERLGEDNDAAAAAPGKSKRKAVSHIGGFDLHGDVGRQGMFMGEMASYFNDFSARYYSIPLASNIAFLFKNKRIGQIKLAEIPSKLCQIEVITAESCIEVVSYPFWIANKEKRDTGTVQSTPAHLEKAAADEAYAAVNAVWEVLTELNSAGGCAAVTAQSVSEICSYCKSAATNPIRFSVCGHLSCQSCFETAANQFAERLSSAPHLCCPVASCATCIAFEDVSKYTNEVTKTAVLIKGIQLYSEENPDRSQVVVCPSENCQTILPKHMPYRACKNCSAKVCLLCGSTDDRVHDAVSADLRGRALNPAICKLAANIRNVAENVEPQVYKGWLQQLQGYGAHSVILCKKLIAEMPACNLHLCPAGHVMSGARSSMQASMCGFVDNSVLGGATCTAKVRQCPNETCGEMVADHGAMYLTCGACQTGFCVACKLVDNFYHAELSGSQNFRERQVCTIVAAIRGSPEALSQLDTTVLQTLRDCNHSSVLHAIQAKDLTIASCPVPSCWGIKKKTDMYCRCVKCNFFTCAACGLVDKEEHTGRTCTAAAAEIRRKENEREQQLRAEAERKRREEEERARILAEKKLKEEEAARAAKEARRKAEEEKKRKEALQRQLKDLTHIFGDSTDIFADCERWVREQWQAGSARIHAIHRNEGIVHKCSSAQRFLKGAKSVNLNLKARSSYRFAWHGTSEEAISPICESGFDPSKRSGQAYGRGEYFGLNNKISEGYCRGGAFMIVAVLLERTYSTHDICYVVDNPVSWEHSYCLPLMVVNFGTVKPSPLRRYPEIDTTVEDAQQDYYEPGAYKSMPFRWHWMQDNGKMERYFDPANVQLERHYDEYAMRGGNARPIVNIVRYLDDVPQNYCIDFERNEQRNATTGFKRSILRKADPIPPGGSWHFLNDGNCWQRHDSEMAEHMSAHHQAYQSGTASSLMLVEASTSAASSPCKCSKRAHKFGMFSYDVDFCVGTQRNRSSGTTRQIKKA